MVNKINIKNRSLPGEWRLSESHTTGEVPGTTDEAEQGKWVSFRNAKCERLFILQEMILNTLPFSQH